MKKLDKRRRRENKTNYLKRLILLKSDTPRLIVRKTNRYIILQIVESDKAQDKVIVSVNTKELLKYGWPKENVGSLKSLSAAYLAGILIAKKSVNKKIKECILDSGLIPSTKGSRIYACVKGAIDGGLKIPHDKNILPTNDMINKYSFLDKIKKNIEDKK
ncbi:MAG: 50S ribosomal protein L18 [Nanoarchaeota archaeon]